MHFFETFSYLRIPYVRMHVLILQQISKITRTIMDNSIKSLVLDTIGIIGMFFVAAILLCV